MHTQYGEQILRAREALSLTQAILAERAGLLLRSLRRYEGNEREVPPAVLTQINRVLREQYFRAPTQNDAVIAFLADPLGLGAFNPIPRGDGPGGKSPQEKGEGINVVNVEENREGTSPLTRNSGLDSERSSAAR